MKKTISFSFITAGLLTFLMLTSCGNSSSLGKEVNTPFSGSKYESSKRYFRAVGKASSKDENISKSKADLQAKKELAQQVQTTMKVVAEQYSTETGMGVSSKLNDKFVELARQVTHTEIADIQKIGQKTYFRADTEKYTTFIALEIHKKQMLRFLKKKAKADASIGKNMRRTIERILDDELEKLED